MKRFVLRAALRVFAVAAIAVAANATIIYDSTAGISGGADPILNAGPLFDSFSTGAFSGTISSLELALESTAATGTTTVGLYSDSSTSPASLITTLGTVSDSSLISSVTLVDVALVSNPVVNAGTRYWIGLSTSDSSALWSYTFDTSGVGVNGEWFANANGVFPNNPDGGYQMQVGLTPNSTPEPATAGLCGLALLGLAAGRLRRCRG